VRRTVHLEAAVLAHALRAQLKSLTDHDRFADGGGLGQDAEAGKAERQRGDTRSERQATLHRNPSGNALDVDLG
jgi:hypothetical protein